MKILVTGGAGFIGSHLVDELLKRGDEVTVVDDLSTGSFQNIETRIATKFHFIHMDIGTGEFNQIVLKKFDVVYHLAARPWSNVPNILNKSRMFYSNVVGTYNIVEKNPDKLIVFTSTANVYGNGRKFKEKDVLKIPSTYGLTKAIAEQIVSLSGNPHVIFRPGTVIGTRGRCFPNRLVWCAVNDTPVEIFNDGNTRRDIIDVRDVVSALLIAGKLEYGTYNLGANTEVKGADLAVLVYKIAEQRGYKLKYWFTKSYPIGYVPESTLVTKLEGSGLWKPTHKLIETLIELFDYYEQGGVEPPSWESL